MSLGFRGLGLGFRVQGFRGLGLGFEGALSSNYPKAVDDNAGQYSPDKTPSIQVALYPVIEESSSNHGKNPCLPYGSKTIFSMVVL